MASSSSSFGKRRYDVFVSYYIPDVHKTFLGHLRKQLSNNGITMFDDQGIERAQAISPKITRAIRESRIRKELSHNWIKMFDAQGIERSKTITPKITRAIRESRISIVVLSKNYASSSWCLDELFEIFKCRKDIGQIVMTIFDGVHPSDVRKQTGEFWIAFNKTCARRKEKDMRKWSQALENAVIRGEHFLNWDNESHMIEKIARDVSTEVYTTITGRRGLGLYEPERKWSSEKIRQTRAIDQGLVVYEPSLSNKRKSKSATILQSQAIDQGLVVNEPSSSNNRKSKSRCFTVMAFFVVINLLLEIASAVADQLSSIRKPYFARISLVMSVLSVVLSILDLTYKVRAQKARFRCKWPIPWFYYPSRGYRRIFGSFTDTVLLFCVVGGLVVSTINYSFIEKGKDGPIKVSLWPLFFSIGMVASKFMEKPVISKDHSL